MIEEEKTAPLAEKNIELSPEATTEEPKSVPKTRKRRSKAEMQESKSETFTDADIAEFKAWKDSRSKKSEVVCEAPDDDKLYRMWKEESRLVKGIFRCREPDGGNVKFAFKKYKWDQTKWYTLYDGETYEIPLAVARHLNQNCSYAEHTQVLDAQGNPTVNTKGKIKSRMNFESTEFAA